MFSSVDLNKSEHTTPADLNDITYYSSWKAWMTHILLHLSMIKTCYAVLFAFST